MPASDDVLTALVEFVARTDRYEPDAPIHTELDVNGVRLTVRAPVARALAEALRAYHDPRDHGRCDHCGSHQMDANFQCRECGRLSGLFGQMVAERLDEYAEPTALPGQRKLPAGSGDVPHGG
ncbi:hypothetical protein [Cryptosporangium minutisporangium]|uniref:Uncharacterized protein n=1 Tax=Cryptosporangium minutisporangium TaxID=113569 RepID=A0ABP6T7E9_9ACTN